MRSVESFSSTIHVLRHSFRPSDRLDVGINQFFQSGLVNAQPPLSTRAVFVSETKNVVGKSSISRDMFSVRRAFERARGHFGIEAVDFDRETFARPSGAVGLRLLFWVSPQDINHLHQLQAPLIEFDQGKEIVGADNTIPQNYDLYLDISSSKSLEMTDPDAVIDQFNEKIKAQRDLYYVTTQSIVRHA